MGEKAGAITAVAAAYALKRYGLGCRCWAVAGCSIGSSSPLTATTLLTVEEVWVVAAGQAVEVKDAQQVVVLPMHVTAYREVGSVLNHDVNQAGLGLEQVLGLGGGQEAAGARGVSGFWVLGFWVVGFGFWGFWGADLGSGGGAGGVWLRV